MPSIIPVDQQPALPIGSLQQSSSSLPPSSLLKPSPKLQIGLFFSDSVPQDYVILSNDVFTGLFGSQSDENRFVVFNNIGESTASSKWTLFRVLPHDSYSSYPQLQGLSLPPKSCLVSSISRHAIASLSSVVYVRSINPVTLDQALILCPPETYNQLQNNTFNDFTRIITSSSSSYILRQGEFCQALGGIVKLCDPVDQGVIDLHSTKITIVNDTSAALPSSHTNETSSTNQDNSYSLQDTSQIDNEISKYLDFVNDWESTSNNNVDDDNLAHSNLSSNGTSTSDKINSLTNGHSSSVHLNGNVHSSQASVTPSLKFSKPIKLQALSQQMPLETIIPLPLPKDDPESRGFVKIELLAEIGCFSGDVVSTIYQFLSILVNSYQFSN